MSEDPESILVSVDLRGPSAEADCVDCLVALPAAIEKMRRMSDTSDIPETMAAHTREAFARVDAEGGDTRIVAAGASDRLYRHFAQLTMMDQYTRAYIRKAIRPFFEQLTKREILTYYILDNTLRVDRLQGAIEIFQLAGVSVVTPPMHGWDWEMLRSQIRTHLESGSHLAYIEPNAMVNYIELARQLAGEFACVASLRNLAPEDPSLQILSLGSARP